MRLLGAGIADLGPGYRESRLPFPRDLTRRHGRSRGGVVAAPADVAGGYVAFAVLDPDATDVTVELVEREGEPWRFTRHRRWLNNLVGQDHRRVKRRTGPMLGFQGFWTARRTLAGVEAMAMLTKGQVRAAPANDMLAQRAFVAGLFGLAA
jgi:DDE domain